MTLCDFPIKVLQAVCEWAKAHCKGRYLLDAGCGRGFIAFANDNDASHFKTCWRDEIGTDRASNAICIAVPFYDEDDISRRELRFDFRSKP